jgi:CTP:phosphocholine cytidylyltransferase-like protein
VSRLLQENNPNPILQQSNEVVEHQFVLTHKRINDIILIIDELRTEMKYLKQELHTMKLKLGEKQKKVQEWE